MKTKNMRKKALLASVAMLLVAVVALGGATYAWFTTNSSVTAQGVNLASAKAANLFLNTKKTAGNIPEGVSTGEASEQYPAWAETITLASPEGTLQPNSSNDGTDFYRISGLTSDGLGGYTVTDLTKDKTGVATIEFAIMSGKDNTRVGLTIGYDSDNSNSNMYSSLRIAVKIGNNNVAIYSPSGNNSYAIDAAVLEGDDDAKYLGTATLENFYNHTTIQGITFAQPTLATASTALTAASGDNALKANTPQVVTVLVWMEGQDRNSDNRAINKAVQGLTFQFEELT